MSLPVAGRCKDEVMTQASRRRQELDRRHKLKQELVDEQYDERGYNWCESCGRGTMNLDLSHTIPLGRGGKTERGNLCLLCRTCHQGLHV